MKKLFNSFSIFLIVAFIAAATLLSCVKNDEVNEEVLAEIENLKVTEAHFESAFRKYYYRSGESLVPSFENKNSVLENEFNTYVLATYARDVGLAEDAESLQKKGLIQRKVMVEEFLEREVLTTVNVTEQDLRDLFYRFNTQLKASHLYAKNLSNAEKLYTRLQQGESFEKIAEDTFDNEYLAVNGGDLGWFTVDEMDLAFENAAYALEVGEISEPVKTNQGFSIIKLTDKSTEPIITETEYASSKNRLYPFALQRNEELKKRNHIEKTVASLNIKIEKLSELWEDIQHNHDGRLSIDFEAGTLKLNTNKADNTVLSSYNDFSFTILDLKQEGYYSPEENLFRIDEKFRFENYVKGLIYRTYLIHQFQKKYKVEEKSIKGSIDQTYYEYLNDRAMQHIKNSIELTKEELRAEFNSNKSMYDFPLRLNVARIVVENEEKGNQVVRELNEGLNWKVALKKYTIKNEDLMVDGEMGLKPIQEYGTHAFFIKDMQVGEIVGPLEYQTGQLMIYKALKILEPRPTSFEEVSDLVRDVLLEKKFKEKQKNIIEQTKQRHNAVFNTEQLKALKIKL